MNRRIRPAEVRVMVGIEDSRWVAMSALGAAMFAVGFSCAGVACNDSRGMSVAEAERAAAAVSVPAPAASLSSIAKVINGAASLVPVAPSATPTAVKFSNGGKANGEIDAPSEALKLRRFVVARKIQNREPVAGDDFKLGSAPVFAFVEFENSARDARSIRLMFQNEETKATVGHVKLTVPGGAERFRTWGNTRMIRDPGHWVAVVSTAEGVELGRAAFEVKG